MYDYYKFKLENNIDVIYIPNKTNISAIQIFVKVGSVDENSAEKGISHFLEHILFKGTKKRKIAKAIAIELDSLGAYFNAYTDKDVTCFIVKVKTDYIKVALDILSDMIFNSLFNEKAVEMERNVVIEELNKYKDSHITQVIENLDKIIYKNHPLMYPIIGEQKDINNLTKENIIKFWKKYYCSNNISISVCSNKSKIEIQFLLNAYFNNYNFCENINVNKESKLNIQSEPRYNIIYNKKIEQVYLALGFPSCDRYNNDKYILEIIVTILAGNMSSRLFTSMREKNGLSYNISSDVNLYKDNGSINIVTSFDKDSLILKNINEIKYINNFNQLYESIFNDDKFGPGALPIIIHELHKLKTELVKDDELSKIIGFLEGTLTLDDESCLNLSEWYGRQLIEQHSIINKKQLFEKYKSVTPEDIMNISKKYFDFNKLNISIIGNYDVNYVKSFINYYIFNEIYSNKDTKKNNYISFLSSLFK